MKHLILSLIFISGTQVWAQATSCAGLPNVKSMQTQQALDAIDAAIAEFQNVEKLLNQQVQKINDIRWTRELTPTENQQKQNLRSKKSDCLDKIEQLSEKALSILRS